MFLLYVFVDTYIMAPLFRKLFFLYLTLFFTAAIPLHAQILSEEESEYMRGLGVVRMCVDPDWAPYESLNSRGEYEGIGADLVGLIAERLGIQLQLVPTEDWDQSIEYSKTGKCDILPFLNQTSLRDEWLLFTEPYFTDPNVLITREEHDYISNLSGIRGESIVLPMGTSIEERVRKDYPNIKIVTTDSEDSVFRIVEERNADMTLRPLTVAAYTIKKEGWFNLKISGELPAYANYFRIAVVSEKPRLIEILNKGVRTITPEDVQTVVNRHASILVNHRVDNVLVLRIVFGFFILLFIGFLWVLQLRRLNRKLTGLTLELHRLAQYDNLTELPNRALFTDRLRQAILHARRGNLVLAVLFIDLDGFKAVNDTFGHETGDATLKEAASRIISTIRASDTAARMGGDEFVVLLNSIDSIKAAEQVGDKICQQLAAPYYFDQKIINISSSIGIAIFPDHGDSDTELLRMADSAMYSLKKTGKNSVALFSMFEH